MSVRKKKFTEKIIESFIPKYIQMRQDHFNTKVKGKNNFIYRLLNNKKYYHELYVDETVLIDRACAHIDEKILENENVTKGEWEHAICTLKNSGETLKSQTSESNSLRILFLTLVAFATVLYKLYSKITTVEFTNISLCLSLVASVFILIMIIESGINRYKSGIYTEAINICELMKNKLHP